MEIHTSINCAQPRLISNRFWTPVFIPSDIKFLKENTKSDFQNMYFSMLSSGLELEQAKQNDTMTHLLH